MNRNKIAFIKSGTFSHVNLHMLAILKKKFPEYEIVEIDVGKEVSRTDLANFICVAKEYGTDLLQGRKSYKKALLVRNSHYFGKVRNRLHRIIQTDTYAFTFQTQSLWDASTPGIPHFVYTDHTHLVNLRYPDFDRQKLFSNDWINLEREIYDNASLIFVTSTFAKTSLVEQYRCDPSKIACVYSGINLEIPTSINTKNHNKKNILFVGKQWERKGGPELLEAFKVVSQVHPDATLTIVGCTPNVDIPNCSVIGFVPREDVGEYYEKASVYCLPSKVEPSAVALVEASAYGLPVIAADVGGTADRVLNGKTGYLVRPADVEQLAKVLIELLAAPEKCESFGREGRRFAMEHFVWEKVGAKMKRHIDTLVDTELSNDDSRQAVSYRCSDKGNDRNA